MARLDPEPRQRWIRWERHPAPPPPRGRQAVACRQPGQRPSDPGDPARDEHRLVFEVKAETIALFRDVQNSVREDLGHRVDDDTLLLEIARRALGAGPRDEGRAPYQVAIARCDDCGQSRVDAAGQSHPVDDAFAAMADCDAQRLGEVDARPDGSPHVGEPPPKRATQTIPPAIRRQVLRRDRKRCVVPGCHNHRFLDLHHVTPRSEGGTHDPDNLASLCAAHHRAAHAGTLVVEGKAHQGFTFRHADGSPYGSPLR